MMLTIEEIENGQVVVASYQAFVFGPVAAAALIAVAFAIQQSLMTRNFVMTSLVAGAIAFAAYSLNRDSTCSMGNFHTFAGLTFGFASVMAVVNSYSFVVLELVPELAALTAQYLLVTFETSYY